MKRKQMKIGWQWKKDVWEKIWEWIKRIRKVVTIISIWFVIGLIINQQKLQISNKIQAWAIVTLVFITGIYAYQTHKTVKEAEKRRKADYWERRIKEFYKPFWDILNTMRNEIKIDTFGERRTEEILKDVEDFYWKRRYMIPIDTSNKINELHTDLFIASIDIAQLDNKEVKKLLRQLRMAESKVRTIIVDEWKSIEASIRKIYGY